MKYTEITTHEIACKFLGRNAEEVPYGSSLLLYQQKLIINTIMLDNIAAAINKADGFVPDWEDGDQEKWYPFFNGLSGFAFSRSDYAGWYTGTCVGSRLCFRTEEISDFFGKQFNSLHSEILELKP